MRAIDDARTVSLVEEVWEWSEELCVGGGWETKVSTGENV